MMTIWQYLFILPVFYLNALTPERSYIHQIVNGSLVGSLEFNFTLFAKEFNGVILSCEDSSSNHFHILVEQESVHNKYICISYNTKSVNVYLKQLCGCDPCGDTKINFYIRLTNTTIYIRCNNNSTEELSIMGQSQSNKSANGTMTIIMGNNNMTSIKVSNKIRQMIGCLDAFYYGHTLVAFTMVGDKLLSTCPTICKHNTCNKGLCHAKFGELAGCDCFNTALNGQYCNRDLMVYNSKGNNSYYMVKKKILYFKITWKKLLEKEYCLVEFIGRYNHIIISINKAHLLMNSNIISNKSENGLNFANFVFKDNYLIVKTLYNETQIKFRQKEFIRINIGLSEKTTTCETFEGAYDIFFNWSSQFIVRTTSVGPMNGTIQYKSTTSAYVAVQTSPTTSAHVSNTVIVIVIAVVLVIVLVLYAANLAIQLRQRHNAIPDHISEEEVFELRLHNDTVTPTTENPPYTSINERDMYMVNRNRNEDIDGYILPTLRPLLPLPNENN